LKDIRQKLLATFQIEHRDHVEQIRSLLAMIEKTAGQPSGPELDEAFRRAHSLKGAARAVDLRPVEGLAHRMETLFSRVRQGVMPLDKDVAGIVQQVLDASEDCVTALNENRTAASVEGALQAIERVLGIEPETAPATPIERPAAPAFQPLETVRITSRNFDGLLHSAGGLLTESRHHDQITGKLNSIVREIARVEKESEGARRIAAAALRRPNPRRDLVRLSNSLSSMEQQVRSLARQSNELRRLQQRSCWTMRNLGKQLQQDVWQARMVPAESLLEGYRKIVRDLARDQSKEIELRTSCASGVQADRRVLEALKDALLHLLRNAVSHGIETPRKRAARGKPPSGLVTIRIDANGQRLTLSIQDDGCGIDFSRVAEVAVRDGILTQPEAARSSPRELARVLFRPGFSTSPSVTDLSGRGMGLSVVYEAVRRLQGELDVQPVDGGGTLVHLSVPISIATHRLLIVRCSDCLLGIPLHGIERLQRIQRSSIQTVEGRPSMVFNRDSIPLLSLHQLLGLELSSPSSDADILRVIVVRSGTRRVAVLVDEFLWEIDAVIQDLGRLAGRAAKISSGVLLEDGAIALVLNPAELMENPVPVQMPPPSKAPGPAPKRTTRSILVVDDSMTTRTLEKSILEAHGYQVRVAVDGVEALALLRAETADLVIADIEMPRLNGFGLLEAMKKDPNLARIPVIVVTSLERREDQEKGLALGADAYIVKRKFDQAELLAVIRQIL
jgi:two-component system, chemotaxis family, sensor kinase CheA